MYERYYGFAEKPFSLTPDPKFLYRGQSHGNAFDLLQYAIRRREGFIVVTGDIGTGKTTLCRALLEQIDRNTFTALVLNPFLTEEDLLKRILQDFGVISREEIKAGRLARVSKQELVDTLYDFLLGLIPLKASAVLIIDEAQNLPLPVLEQIRILSNLETDKEKLLQIILVGQLELQSQLRSPNLRQLDQRVSIRYELKPLDREAVAAYVAHRLAIAGGAASVSFTADALTRVHRLSGGIPRLINLICDRALLAGFSAHATQITPEMIMRAAESLDLPAPAAASALARLTRLKRPAPVAAALAGMMVSSALAVGATAYVYQRFAGVAQAASMPARAETPARDVTPPHAQPGVDRTLPADAALTILVGSYPIAESSSAGDVRALTDWLEAAGFRVFYADVNLGSQGRWRRVLAGAYADSTQALGDAARLKTAVPSSDARIVTSGFATGTIPAPSPEPETGAQRSGLEP
ncbi:MAG: AAA family ATPase [Acidobacteriia bacterium]|nr:AAA family ATPase [Terriglobia bacterium]